MNEKSPVSRYPSSNSEGDTRDPAHGSLWGLLALTCSGSLVRGQRGAWEPGFALSLPSGMHHPTPTHIWSVLSSSTRWVGFPGLRRGGPIGLPLMFLTHLVFRLLVWPSLPLLFTVGLFLGAPFRLLITEGLFASLRTFLKFENRTSLVVQWLRIHLPKEGTRVQSLVQQDSTYYGATEPVSYNY